MSLLISYKFFFCWVSHQINPCLYSRFFIKKNHIVENNLISEISLLDKRLNKYLLNFKNKIIIKSSIKNTMM